MRFGLGQVVLGQQGGQRASDAHVRELATALASTWAEETWTLRALGRAEGAQLAKQVAEFQRRRHAALMDLSGERYDRAFVQLVAAEHELVLSSMDERHPRTERPAIRVWIERVRPLVAEQLAKARQLEARLAPSGG